jgi:hypothetical protein
MTANPGFQSTVNFDQGFGIQGELFDDGPVRAQPAVIFSNNTTPNTFGFAATWTGTTTTVTSSNLTPTSIAQMGNPGGTFQFAGFMVNPKAASSNGTNAGGTLFPTLTVPDLTTVELLNMGSIVVSLPAAAAVGDIVIFDNVTGALATIAPGASVPSGKTFAQAIVDRFPISGASLAVIRVMNTPNP